MRSWNIEEFVSHLSEEQRSLDIGDNVQILYKEKLTPVKINGKIKPELKRVKGSYCIYEMEEYAYFNTQNKIEMIAIEEYSDSPHSIYIDETGVIESYEYENITTIELGDTVILTAVNSRIQNYYILRQGG